MSATTPEAARIRAVLDELHIGVFPPAPYLNGTEIAERIAAALTPLAPEVPPRRFARGLVNTPADQIEVLRQALDTVARIHHGLHDGRFDDCERDTCRRSRRALGTAALDLAATRTPEPPDPGDADDAIRIVFAGHGITPFDTQRVMAVLYAEPTLAGLIARLRSGSPAPEGGE